MVGSGSRRDGANASEVVLHGKVFDSYASCKAFGLQRRDIKLIIIDVNKLCIRRRYPFQTYDDHSYEFVRGS